MAKVSAHGKEIGTIYRTTTAIRFMSDGKVLKNIGFGWKIASLKPGKTYETLLAAQKDWETSHPMSAAYRKELHELAGMDKRWKLHAAVQLMHNDPDGVWSEACDGYGDNVHADIDEVSNLCRLYQSAIAEQAELRTQQATE